MSNCRKFFKIILNSYIYNLIMQKILIILGIVILVIGLLYPYIKKIGLGQLPGDVIFKSGNSTFLFPVVTCIIISVVLTIIFNLFK